MALAMSAAAIHSQATSDPGVVLHSLMSTLKDELTLTEMFISGFYAVIDPQNSQLVFANTGHPHAFHLPTGGDFVRLEASNPPIGMDDRRPATVVRDWKPKQDLLVLFTDGVSDARNVEGERLGEERILDTIRDYRTSEPREILDRVMAVIDEHTAGAPRRDDLTVVLARG
jgi:serine phosphatase RsbU (regulator of sigma subunit)